MREMSAGERHRWIKRGDRRQKTTVCPTFTVPDQAGCSLKFHWMIMCTWSGMMRGDLLFLRSESLGSSRC